MQKKNSMESTTIVISMVIRLMNAKRNLSLKENVTNVRSMGTNHHNAKPRYWIQQKNYKSYIWLGLQHLVQMSLLWRIWTHWNWLWKTSLEEKRYYQRCFICTELGRLAKNYMNTGRIEDEKKAKADNIRKQMRQQWVQKSTKNTSPSNDDQVTQELGDSTISTWFLNGELELGY